MTETGNLTWGYVLGALGFASLFIVVPLLVLLIGTWINRKVDQRVNLHVHQALHPNVRVLPEQRSAR